MKESKNKIKVDFDRTPLKERMKAKFLNLYFFQQVAWYIFRLVLLIGISYIVLYPFFTKIAGSFMSPEDFVDVTVRLIPKHFTLDIYKAVLTELKYAEAFRNTFIISMLCGVLQTFVCCLIAYGLAKFRFRGNKLIFTAILVFMMIPGQLGLIGFYNLCTKLHLVNSYLPLILPAIAAPGTVFFLRQYVLSVMPPALIEAARIDGLSEVRIFFQMFIPTMKSTYAAAAVITFMNAWNSYLWPKVIMTDNKAMTMPMLIANLITGYVTDYGMLMCGVLFCSIPTMIVFFVLQKQFAEGITGAVK